MDNKRYDLTVCICIYNGAKYIAETLESLWNQTFREFDLLIVNDCSTDNTVEVIQNFLASRHWQNTRIVDLPKNLGLAGARKQAEAIIDTPLVLFFDADDLALPSMIETMHRTISNSDDCMAVGCYCQYCDEKGKDIYGGISIGPVTAADFFRETRQMHLPFMVACSMFRRSIAARVGGRHCDGFPSGFPRYQDMCEDLDLWSRMSDLSIEGKYLIVIPEVLFKYRKLATSVSADSRAMNLRIRHIKTNLKRRRVELPELTFINYMATITLWQRFRFLFSDKSCNCYKQAGFHFMRKHYLRFIGNLILAGVFSPRYVLQKIRKNIIPALQHK